MNYVMICNVFKIYICFHDLFVRAVVTNKDEPVYISLLIYISALLSDPQAGQLYFIPGTGRNFSYHHLVQIDTEIQPGSYQRGARGSFPGSQTSSVKLPLTFMSYQILKCVDPYLHIHFKTLWHGT